METEKREGWKADKSMERSCKETPGSSLRPAINCPAGRHHMVGGYHMAERHHFDRTREIEIGRIRDLVLTILFKKITLIFPAIPACPLTQAAARQAQGVTSCQERPAWSVARHQCQQEHSA